MTTYWLADQALLYEAQYFRKAKHNWLDLRVYSEYLTDDTAGQLPLAALLVNGGNTNRWAYGAAGIGLVRLRALELHSTTRYHQESQAALINVGRALARRHGATDSTLNTGAGGRAELLVAAAELTGNTALQIRAQQAALVAVRQRHQRGHWLGKDGLAAGPALLNGTAGIGYFLLRTLNPAGVDSVLLPRLPRRKSGQACAALRGLGSRTIARLRRQVWGRYFERTLCLLTQVAPTAATNLFDNEAFPAEVRELHTLQSHLSRLIRELAAPAKSVLSEAFRLEKAGSALQLRQPGFIQRVIKKRLLEKQAQELASLKLAAFLTCSFRISPLVRVLANRWTWPAAQPVIWLGNLSAPAAPHSLLLVAENDAVADYALGAFPAALLRALKRPAAATHVLQQVSQQLNQGQDAAARTTLAAAVVAQLTHFSAAGIIELVGPPPRSP